MKELPNIRSLDKPGLEKWLVEEGEKPFRSRQVLEWLWKHHAGSFDEMQNLGKGLREKLGQHFTIGTTVIESRQVSSDRSIKYIFRLSDGNRVEGVLIPTESRVTACVSSQVGCSLSCKFCATGYLDLKKNLLFYEIFDQVAILKKEAEENYGRPLSNVVYMGMGEPLLNYRNVLKSVEWVTSEEGLGMSPRRITVSTAGIAKMIKKLGDDNVKFEFALSLHAANDAKRSEIMPINEQNSLGSLLEALQYFYQKTETRITFEYIVFKDFNDTVQDARELLQFARAVPSKINIIEYNPISGAVFSNTTEKRMAAFMNVLESGGLIVNVRKSRGRDIDGACGQLALKQTI